MIPSDATKYPFLLVTTENRVELCFADDQKSKPLYVDFLSAQLKYRIKHGGGRNQLLAKAVGIKGNNKPFVLDVTAGLGTDAYILASLGCEVVMIERSPIIGALLADGVKRARSELNEKNIKLTLEIFQSVDYINNFLNTNLRRPDVVYLDPMYPERDKSALGKKQMRCLRAIVGDDTDASVLFSAARKVAQKRVVVKRPRFSSQISDDKPDLIISSGKSSRYDIYFNGINN